jgi:uncharacterized protein YqfB (UPF0267 family)
MVEGPGYAAIAIAGVAIACAQLRIANVRLTHDLFDRRYAVYAATRKFVQQICQKRTITIEELSSFHYASGDAVFVLDQGVADYLEKLRTNAVRAAKLYDKIGNQGASQAEIQEHWNLLDWASNQIDVLAEKFKPFLQLSRSWSQRLKIVRFAALSLVLLVGRAGAENAFPPPTATEIFHLRSECGALGKKILDAHANIIGQALEKSQISHYNPQTNRCYVQLTVLTADTTDPFPVITTNYLYDGQTDEILAVAQTRKGLNWGFVEDQSHQAKTLAHGGWHDTIEYIHAMMADDRRQ